MCAIQASEGILNRGKLQKRRWAHHYHQVAKDALRALAHPMPFALLT